MAEAQRLIAVSLGKIAHNRGQRGGASLYKNLLVSTVLHKARHVYMVENFSAMMQVSYTTLNIWNGISILKVSSIMEFDWTMYKQMIMINQKSTQRVSLFMIMKYMYSCVLQGVGKS